MNPLERTKPTWYGEHVRTYRNTITKQAEVVLLGDSLVSNLSRYPNVWDHHLAPLNAINCGIRGDRKQNVMWRVDHMYLPATVSVGVIHCGINDINEASTHADRPQGLFCDLFRPVDMLTPASLKILCETLPVTTTLLKWIFIRHHFLLLFISLAYTIYNLVYSNRTWESEMIYVLIVKTKKHDYSDNCQKYCKK